MKMDTEEGPIIQVNNDCVLNILNLLPLQDVMSFGATNKRFRDLIIDNYTQLIGQSTIQLIYIRQSTRRILRLFGRLFLNLEIRFNQTEIPAELFADEGRCFIESIVNLRLYICIEGDEIGQVPDEIQVLDYLGIYERSVTNILNFVNVNELTNMASLLIEFSLNFQHNAYYDFLALYLYDVIGFIRWVNVGVFRDLRRGNLNSNHYLNDYAHRYVFELNLNF